MPLQGYLTMDNAVQNRTSREPAEGVLVTSCSTIPVISAVLLLYFIIRFRWFRTVHSLLFREKQCEITQDKRSYSLVVVDVRCDTVLIVTSTSTSISFRPKRWRRMEGGCPGFGPGGCRHFSHLLLFGAGISCPFNRIVRIDENIQKTNTCSRKLPVMWSSTSWTTIFLESRISGVMNVVSYRHFLRVGFIHHCSVQ